MGLVYAHYITIITTIVRAVAWWQVDSGGNGNAPALLASLFSVILEYAQALF
jgi:hypothetical protein